MTIYLASDHAGYELKTKLLANSAPWLPPTPNISVELRDLGPFDAERVDYPQYAASIAKALNSEQQSDFGILICGSGIGVSIAANRFPHIRAALCDNPVAAKLAREHNFANVLCLGARFHAYEYATEIIRAFFNASPDTTGRHSARVKQLTQLPTL